MLLKASLLLSTMPNSEPASPVVNGKFKQNFNLSILTSILLRPGVSYTCNAFRINANFIARHAVGRKGKPCRRSEAVGLQPQLQHHQNPYLFAEVGGMDLPMLP